MAAAEITIDSIAAGGDGVGRADGMVVFVPRTAPGDVVTATLAGKKRFARGQLLQIERPSPDRIEPLCPHYVVDRCGGCQLQHMSYAAQLRAKSRIILDGVARIGKRAVEAPSVVPSPNEWRYRTKLTLAMRATPSGKVIGLHRFDDPVGVFQLGDCPITDERVVAVWKAIFGMTDRLPRRATRGSVRLTSADTASVMIEGDDVWPDAASLLDELPTVDSLWWKPENQSRRLVASRHGSMTGASFAQVNTRLAHTLREFVIDRARSYRPASIVDAYAGSGATAIPLASDGLTVTAIEMDKFAAAAIADGVHAPSRSLTGRVEDLLPSALPADVVLLNPPRTGLADAVPAQLETAVNSTRAIIYVSCNPATLGRDVARLPSYRIELVRGFDMFPQTAHVETVCELVPAS
jgi:23S rRNA (uracil1939-C5)-methyltransferase